MPNNLFSNFVLGFSYDAIRDGSFTFELFKEKLKDTYIPDDELIRIYNQVKDGTITRDDFITRGKKYIFKD